MSPKLLPQALAALCALLIIWRLAILQSEVTRLSGALPLPLSTPGSGHAQTAALGPTDPAPLGKPAEIVRELEKAREDLQQAQDRITELETSVEELASAWNHFADEEETKRKRAAMRAWGPEQAVGPPDTPVAGDHPTAWASLTADGGAEWLQADFAEPADAAQIRVLENDNPGAVVKITGYLENGGEVVLWQGTEPRLPPPADQVFNVPAGYRVRSVRVHLDTAKVPGWNEIDAVELIGRDGSRQWAARTSASSTYAKPSRTLGNSDFEDSGFQTFR